MVMTWQLRQRQDSAVNKIDLSGQVVVYGVPALTPVPQRSTGVRARLVASSIGVIEASGLPIGRQQLLVDETKKYELMLRTCS